MPTFSITITVDVPDGTDVGVSAPALIGQAEGDRAIPDEVADAIQRFVPVRYREWVESYVNRCVAELGCSVAIPKGRGRVAYLNVFPPEGCRRARVAGVTYSSSRTAVYVGPIDIARFDLAQKTLNSGTYAYPKLSHLDSAQAVEEAIELTRLAIQRLER